MVPNIFKIAGGPHSAVFIGTYISQNYDFRNSYVSNYGLPHLQIEQSLISIL